MKHHKTDILEADLVDSGILKANHLNINRPVNHGNVKVLESGGNHVVMKSSTEEIGPLALMVGDDNAAAGEGGYAAAMHFLTESGERIATNSADTVHGHWNLYTSASPLGDGEDTQPVKRMVVDAESPLADVEFPNVKQVRFRPNGGGDSPAQMNMFLDSDSGEDAYIKIQEGGTQRGIFWHDASQEKITVKSYYGPSTVELLPSGSVRIPTGGPNGTGRIEFGNGSALYEDANGDIVAENSSGTTTVIT